MGAHSSPKTKTEKPLIAGLSSAVNCKGDISVTNNPHIPRSVLTSNFYFATNTLKFEEFGR